MHHQFNCGTVTLHLAFVKNIPVSTGQKKSQHFLNMTILSTGQQKKITSEHFLNMTISATIGHCLVHEKYWCNTRSAIIAVTATLSTSSKPSLGNKATQDMAKS